jgi:hypothetical protein
MADDRLHADLILIRTSKGQGATLDFVQLDASQRRLLLLVNGFTPLGHLTKLLDRDDDWAAVAKQLLARGLVAAVME